MQGGFTKGLVIGSLIGASMSMMMNPENMNGRNKKRMMRMRRTLMRKSGGIIGDVIGMLK